MKKKRYWTSHRLKTSLLKNQTLLYQRNWLILQKFKFAMAISAAKENILKRIRQALSNPVPLPFPLSEGAASVYQPATDALEVIFAEEFSKLQGKFAFCMDEHDLQLQVQELITAKE